MHFCKIIHGFLIEPLGVGADERSTPVAFDGVEDLVGGLVGVGHGELVELVEADDPGGREEGVVTRAVEQLQSGVDQPHRPAQPTHPAHRARRLLP